jgi:hypothetical protein
MLFSWRSGCFGLLSRFRFPLSDAKALDALRDALGLGKTTASRAPTPQPGAWSDSSEERTAPMPRFQ